MSGWAVTRRRTRGEKGQTGGRTRPQGWEGVRRFLQAQDWVLSAQLWVPGKSFQVKISHLRWGAGWEGRGRGCRAGAGMPFQAQGVQSLAAFQEGLLPRPPPEWPPVSSPPLLQGNSQSCCHARGMQESPEKATV